MKRACEGARKRPPPHTKRPWTPCVRGSLAPQATKDADKNPKQGGGQYAPAQKWAVPWESLLRGVGKTTLRVSETTPGHSRESVAAKQKGKKKSKTKETHEDPCRLASQEKGLRRSKENPKNPRGPEWHPGKTPRSGTHGQNGQNRQKRRDTKRKRTRKTGACAGVSCYYLNCIS